MYLYIVIKIEIFIKCNAKKFGRWHICKDWISNCNVVECVFLVLVGDHHTWSFTNVERKYVGVEPVNNFFQFYMNIVNALSYAKSDVSSVNNSYQFYMNIVNALSDAKAAVSSEKCAKRIWFEDL